MNPPLRPMNLGENLDRSVHIYRRRFLIYVCLAAIPASAMILVFGLNEFWPRAWSAIHPHGAAEVYLWKFATAWATYEAVRVVGILIEPALVQVTADSILNAGGSLSGSIRFALARWRSSLWIAFLKVAVDVVFPLALSAAVGLLIIWSPIGSSRHGTELIAPLSYVLNSIASYALLLWVGACLGFAIPATVAEGVTGIAALRRSIILSQGSRFRIMLTLVIAYLLTWILSWSGQFTLAHLMPTFGSLLHIADAMRRLYGGAAAIVTVAAYVLVGPFLPIAITLLYYDQRIRREGYDLERMMDAAGLNPNATAPLTTAPAPAASPALAAESAQEQQA